MKTRLLLLAFLRMSAALSIIAIAVVTTAAGITAAERPDRAVEPDELAGFWTGDWGGLLLLVEGNRVWGVYEHDDGLLSGTVDRDGTLRGWWTEAPTREPDGDAGRIEFRLSRDEHGAILDGRWCYGTDGDWHEDWDLLRPGRAAPERLVERLRLLRPETGESRSIDRVSTRSFAGLWRGDWGDLVLRVDGQEVRGVYTHDEGTFVGTLDIDGVVRGWWTETPTRAPAGDAGRSEFRLIRDADQWQLDGRWMYGSDGSWYEDWDLTRVEGPVNETLLLRFNDSTAFRLQR